jgi:ATPase
LTETQTFVIDKSALTSGAASRLINEGKIFGRIVLHRAIIENIESRARSGDETGLNALKSLAEASRSSNCEIEFAGVSSQGSDTRVDVRELAYKLGATLVTSDLLQAKISESIGIRTLYQRPSCKLKLNEFFKENVMSVHLKEGVAPRVKVGSPLSWSFKELSERPMTQAELEEIIVDIMEGVQSSEDSSSFVEIEKPGSTIVQLGEYRIVITRPPFSDGLEITAVKPITKRSLNDYNLPKEVVERIESRAEGILIAGSPGMGKSTFAQALAEFYRSKGKIVKTVESPRDLQLPADITQYSSTAASPSEIHDVLLLSRPDYTIFDELRTDFAFDIFVDLRLAGIGMVGVVHATSPIDAIQRFVNRVELGLVPSIIDTVLFMDAGEVASIHVLETTVKTPRGMTRQDLARPTIMVKNLMTDEVEYELYVFGEKTFVIPLKHAEKRRTEDRRVEAVEELVKLYIPDAKVRFEDNTIRVYINERDIKTFNKKVYKRLERLKRKIRTDVDVSVVREENAI